MGNLSIGTQGASYYDWARKGRIFTAFATVTAPVIYTTAAGTGGPLLWNNSLANGSGVNAVILAVSASIGATASAVATTMGLTGGISVLPTSTTAIDASGNVFQSGGAQAMACNVYRKGTVATAGAWFMPTHSLDTGAITAASILPAWVDIGGAVMAGPGGWVSVSAAATATSAVCNIGLMWVEIPI